MGLTPEELRAEKEAARGRHEKRIAAERAAEEERKRRRRKPNFRDFTVGKKKVASDYKPARDHG